MSDFKSKLPSFKELTEMTGKLVGGIKKSVTEIVEDYKKNHPPEPEPKVEPPKAESPKTAQPKAAPKPEVKEVKPEVKEAKPEEKPKEK